MLLVELVGQHGKAVGCQLLHRHVQRQLESLAGVTNVGLVLGVEVVFTEAIGGERFTGFLPKFLQCTDELVG